MRRRAAILLAVLPALLGLQAPVCAAACRAAAEQAVQAAAEMPCHGGERAEPAPGAEGPEATCDCGEGSHVALVPVPDRPSPSGDTAVVRPLAPHRDLAPPTRVLALARPLHLPPRDVLRLTSTLLL